MNSRYTQVYRGMLMLTGSLLLLSGTAYAQDAPQPADTTLPAPILKARQHPRHPPGAATSSVAIESINMLPYTTPAQMLAGRASGADVKIQSGAPGVPSLTLIRGTSVILSGNRKADYAQPLYVIDGVPLVLDHPYTYNIRQYDNDRLGPNIDIASLIDINNITAIEVLKDASATMLYGARAVNGVIRITTKQPFAGRRKISVNSYVGIAAKPSVSTINAAFEKDFRMPFYNKYGDAAKRAAFPRYLADSAQAAYYGPANWDDEYYQNAMLNGFGASIAGGSERSNFLFGIGQQREGGVADRTGFSKYDIYFKLNIEPVKNMHVLTSVTGALADRQRGSSLRDRFAETEYLPSLADPLPPNSQFLQTYNSEYARSVNNSRSNSILASVAVDYSFLRNFKLTSLAAIDYNDQNRDFFIPGSVNEGNSFISYYTGLNRRLVLDNALAYTNTFGKAHAFTFRLGQSVQYDYRKYDYTKGYRGPSDFIKIIRAGDKDEPGNNTFDQRLVYNFKDYVRHNLVSFYGDAELTLADKLDLRLHLRSDGSSNLFQTGYTWGVSPVASANWHLVPSAPDASLLNLLDIRASYGHVGRLFADNSNGYGPYYTVEAGWGGTRNISGYGGQPSLSLPFSTGYSGWGTQWPYSEQLNLGADATLFKQGMQVSVDVYSKTDKNLLLSVPAPTESGFALRDMNGMSIRNYGIELTIGGDIRSGDFSWQPVLIAQANRNKLLALPGGLNETVINGMRLETGKPADRFWVLQNNGIYNSNAEVPVNPSTGKPLSYNGVAFKAGDPRWADLNGDFVINDDDRELKGHGTPGISGSFSNTLRYKKLSFNFLLAYALDRQIINARMANRFNFVNNEGGDNLESVKEITWWTKVGDYSKYPMYNPWSFVNPYQAEQSLFVENGAYLKLRSATLSYDLTEAPWAKKNNLSRVRVFLTANNLFTITDYSGADPELTDYRGYDYGFGMPIPRSYTVGFNLDF